MCFIRRYDPLIEEVSSFPIDSITQQQFLRQVPTMNPKRMISFPLLFQQAQQPQPQQNQQQTWYELTNHITQERRGNIKWGDKNYTKYIIRG
jgi:hypothetical protein